MSVEVHELPTPAPVGVTLDGYRLKVIVGSTGVGDSEFLDHGRIKVRTWSRVGRHDGRLDRIDSMSVAELRDFAHGILRVIGDEQ